MRDKLCVSERRTKILEFLVKKKQSTRCELATEFNVSTDTTVSFSNASRAERLIATIVLEFLHLKPLFGNLLYNGI